MASTSWCHSLPSPNGEKVEGEGACPMNGDVNGLQEVKLTLMIAGDGSVEVEACWDEERREIAGE